MKKPISFLVAAIWFLSALFSFNLNSYGWNGRGHMMTSAVAFQELEKNDPEVIEKIIKMLESHPAFPLWQSEYKSSKDDVKRAYSQNAYYFMRASIWADDVRSPKGNPEHKMTWHFVNYPLRLPDSIDFNMAVPKENIFFANTNAAGIIANTNSKREKAKSLSWIFHIVGDIHQPLHSVALRNSDFPNGDSGGNSLCLRPDIERQYADNLHSYWDNLMGSTKSDLYEGMAAWRDALFYSKIKTDINASQFTGIPNMEDWGKESAKLALSNAYQFNGEPIKLWKQVTVKSASGKKYKTCPKDIPDSDVIPANYSIAAKEIAARRIVTAGYRLANVLKRFSA